MTEHKLTHGVSTLFIRELSDTVRQTLFILSFFIIVPVLYWMNVAEIQSKMNPLKYLSNGFGLTVLALIFFLAYNMFRTEDRDGATEYLLSLPFSRWKLFFCKMVPRILILIPVLLAAQFLLYLRQGLKFVSFGWIFSIESFLVLLILYCGFILGVVGRKSWLVGLTLAVIILGSLVTLSTGILVNLFLLLNVNIRTLSESSWLWAVYWAVRNFCSATGWILTPVLLTTAFLPVYRGWDIGSGRTRQLRFAKRVSILMILLAIPIIVMCTYPRAFYNLF